MTVIPSPSFSVDLAPSGARILTLDGALSSAGSDEALEQLRLLLDGPAADLVIDLRGLTAIDAGALAELRTAVGRCEEQQRRAVLVRPNVLVWRHFHLAGLDRSCRSVSCLRDALAAAPQVS